MKLTCITCEAEMTHLVDDLHLCNECGLISSEMKSDPFIYGKYYMIHYERYEKSEIGRKIQELRHDLIVRHIKPIIGSKILDFGCGVGNFVRYCNRNSIETYGFDINPYLDFWDIAVLLKDYDAMTFWDSLEHLANPREIIKGLGFRYVFISTPCVDDFAGDKKELPTWRHYRPQEHIHYFGEESLKSLLTSCDYKVIEWNYKESSYRKGGGTKNILSVAAIHD